MRQLIRPLMLIGGSIGLAVIANCLKYGFDWQWPEASDNMIMIPGACLIAYGLLNIFRDRDI